MAFCSNCGARIADNAKFCPECGSPNTSNFSDSPERQQEYVGKMLKCPSCGEVLKSFEGICPACGHEISSVKMSTSFKAFVDGITGCDTAIAQSSVPPKKGFRTWSKRGKFWWIVLNAFTLCIPLAFYLILPLLGIWGVASLLPAEKRKAALIKNYAFPNDRESVLEILIYIKSQLTFIASEKIDRNAVHWASIWGRKAEQIYQKSEIIIKGDTISASTHNDIVLHWKKIKKSFGVRIAISLTCIAALIIFMAVSGGPFGALRTSFSALQNPFKGFSSSFQKTFEWPDTELSRLLPQPESNEGEISSIDAESLSIEVTGLSISKFEAYIIKCKENGFTVNSKRKGNTFTAYNDNHFYLKLTYTDYSNKTEMTIYLEAPKIVGELQWPDTTLTNIIPDPKSTNGEITENDEVALWVLVYDFSESKYESYLTEIKNYGFTIDSKTGTTTYEAYNENGYHIKIYDQSNEYDWSELFIVLEAPMEMGPIRWPDTKLVNQIPVPKTDLGKIEYNREDLFRVYIGNTTPEEYADYVDACMEKGFTKSQYTHDNISFYAKNSEDSSITVEYIGFGIMKIYVDNYGY